jgi:hypothetical protein
MTGGTDITPNTDAATVIQNAINALTVGGAGGTIHIRGGVYTLASGLTVGVSHGLCFIGDGDPLDGLGQYPASPGGTVLKAGPSFPTGTPILAFSGSSSILIASPRISNMLFDCNSIADGVYLTGVWDAVQDNLSVLNAKNYGFYNIAGTAASGQNNALIKCTSFTSLGAGFLAGQYAENLYSCYSLQSQLSGYIIQTTAPIDLWGCKADVDNQSNTSNHGGFVLNHNNLALHGCGTFQGTKNGPLILQAASYNIVEGCQLNQIANTNGDALIKDSTLHGGNIYANNTYTPSNQTTKTSYLYAGGGSETAIHEFIGGSITNPSLFANYPSLFQNLTNLMISKLVGYTPQGIASIVVGASPFTYTNNDGVSEAIYTTPASTGTVSQISKNSVNKLNANLAGVDTTWLEPGEAMIVTWATAAPTMLKDRK